MFRHTRSDSTISTGHWKYGSPRAVSRQGPACPEAKTVYGADVAPRLPVGGQR